MLITATVLTVLIQIRVVSMSTEASRPPIMSVHRALVLLSHMAEHGSISVTEAAQLLEINPSSAQRILATLSGAGFAQQNTLRQYEPGLAFLRPGIAHQMSLRVQARPYLEDLFSRVHETVHLVTLVGVEIHHLDGIEATMPLRYEVRTGDRMPAHLTSSGKAMYATLPWEEVRARYELEQHVNAENVRRPKPHADVDLDKLEKEIAEVRRSGFGMNLEESGDGVIGIGISLGSIDGAIAAFSLTMPASRYTEEIGSLFRNHLREVSTAFQQSMESALTD